MIGIKLSGGLGNNMFEYASARSLAEIKGVRFCYFSQKNFNFYVKKLKKYFLKKIFGRKDTLKKQLIVEDISTYFQLEINPLKNYIYQVFWHLKKNKYEHSYSFNNSSNIKVEFAKKEFLKCPNWTELKGGFASEIFFSKREDILKWFTPRSYYKKQIDRLESTFKFPPNKRCCIHVRRGDSLFMDKGFAINDLGWSLPEEYFEYVIKKLDRDLLFIFISDDPDWVSKRFKFLPNKIFLRNNSEIVDLFIFSKCKFNILSRSTFSWWGAWLNQIPDKEIYAPKYFIGIPKKKCIPFAMDKGNEVQKWNYIDFDLISK